MRTTSRFPFSRCCSRSRQPFWSRSEPLHGPVVDHRGPIGDHDCPLADAGQPQECVLNLADLYPEATDLDLCISAAEKLQLALGQPAAIVTTSVQPLAFAVRIGQEGSSRALGIVDVPTADT